ncbi:Leucine Rich repeat [Lotmaria passim]
MLKSANSPVSEDEPTMDCTSHSSVTNNALAGLDTIIQSINKRYEVYQRRRTAITPFSSPTDASLGVPPTPRPILGDNGMANVSYACGCGSSSNNNNNLKLLTSQPTRDPLGTSIVAANAHPAPYWEERELYIVAEDLCCYLNGGINYRQLCEQYRRALEVLLTLVKEDMVMCTSGEVEVLPGGTTNVLRKLQSLLKESRTMLESTGVEMPPKLSAMLDQLPTEPEEQPFSESPPAFRRPASSSPNVTHISCANHNSVSAGGGALNGAGGNGPHSPRARPLSALAPGRRQPSANKDAQPPPPRVAATAVPSGGGTRGRPPPSSRSRNSGSTPDTVHLAFSDSVAAGGNVTGGVGGTMRRNTSSSAVIVDPPADGSSGVLSDTVNGNNDGAAAGTHERHSSILRNGTNAATATASLSSCVSTATAAAAPTPISRGGAASKAKHDAAAAHATPPNNRNGSKQRVAGVKAEAEGSGAAADMSRVDDSAMESISPNPSTPPRPPYDDAPGSNSNNKRNKATSQATPVALEVKDGDATAEPSSHLRGRLHLLEELYGEHYALDGMTLLTDALGVVFTREYDQGQNQQYQNGFAAFQRDVNAKVIPTLKSYDAFQLRTTELTPLHSAYMANCVLHRVRPSDAVLDQLKRIDQDRTPETLLLDGLHLGDLGTAAVVESIVPRLYRLRTLNLSDNNLHDNGLEPLLRAIRYHPALTTLDLSYNPISDDGLPTLLRLAQTVPQLSHIVLQSSGMTPNAKRIVETELAKPGTHTTMPLLRRHMSSSSPICGGATGLAMPASSASTPPVPHPPTAHRPPSSMDGRNRRSPKSAARAESMPTRISTAARKIMAVKGSSASTVDSKLPPLPRISPSQTTK